jgi:hypothetical protein
MEHDWTISERWQGLTVGDRVRVAGLRGTFTFARHVRQADGTEWIDCFGGLDQHRMFRSFSPDRVRPANGSGRQGTPGRRKPRQPK